MSAEVAQAITAMSTDVRSSNRIVRDIVIAYVQATQRPPLRDDTMMLLYRVVEAADYGDADALVRDLCLAFERVLRQARGELREEEIVNVDIADMFSAIADRRILTNEEGVTIRKHT